MNFKDWLREGRLKRHQTSQEEITNLFKIVGRDLQDAQVEGSSADARFMAAYNAALKLCTILLFASGYRTAGVGAHYYTIEAIALIMGKEARGDADYLNQCRERRNHAEYDYVDVAEEADIEELVEFVRSLKARVEKWLMANHGELAPRT